MPGHNEKRPKVPVTYLGVDTSQVPTVVSDQLGLAKGFGLVVDYVEPNSPAATAGVQQNDILKMLNDQILVEPSQLNFVASNWAERLPNSGSKPVPRLNVPKMRPSLAAAL